MKKTYLYLSVGLAFAFVAWTLAVTLIDVQAIGPENSSVGFATLNAAFHGITGVNMTLYNVTDWLIILPIGVALAFASLGLYQWIKRGSILKVDASLLLLGAVYVATALIYAVFEIAVINYRPILIEGVLEASYPSSTTLIFSTVIPASAIELKNRIKNPSIGKLTVFLALATAFIVVVARLVCGVHWFSDIVGGALLSGGIVLAYAYSLELIKSNTNKK